MIDLANLTENTKLADLQNRLSLLETNGVQHSVSPYKTPPAPVSKPDMIKPKVVSNQDAQIKQDVTKNDVVSNVAEVKVTDEEFSPMPKASVSVESSSDLMSLWVKLMDNITSPPTKSLLKQWAKPVEITPDKVVISINSENLLKQFVEGNKRNVLIKAVDTLFAQENSNVLVRLPRPEDAKLQENKVVLPKPAVVPVQPEPKEEPSTEEVEMVKQENPIVKKSISNSVHSDMVNMAVDLFDGKIIE